VQPKLLKTSAHPMVDQARCDQCHDQTDAARPFAVKYKGSRLCFQCHPESDLKAGGTIDHQPFQKGDCVACHQPHASENPELLDKAGNNLCFSCHADKNEKLETPHKAVSDAPGCLACHRQHAAKNKKLLNAPERTLCIECHPETQQAKKPPRPHQPFSEENCSVCHNAHGSNFYGMLKTKQDLVCYACHFEAEVQFLKTNTHKPVLDGQCSGCHTSHGGKKEKLLPVAADDPELCVDCHGELMRPATADGSSNHAYFKDGKCLRCHEVHASNFAGMTVANQGFLCFSCHGTDPGQEIKNPKSKHDPVVAGECTRCHSPHKANLESLLLANYPDLCLSCHTDLKARMYPQTVDSAAGGQAGGAGSTTDPETGDAVIYVHAPSDIQNCNICHKPHFAAELDLIVKPIQPLCADCHDYQEPSFRQAHIDANANKMDCRMCHDSHTSTDPKFFKTVMHQPFADRACKDCHITK
jgi:predicted CXXCH cytochrome family protein